MKAAPVSPAAKAGPELHLFGDSAGEGGVEFGLEAFFTVEKVPWVEHVDGCSEAGVRTFVSASPQIAVFLGLLPCRGCDRCDAPKAPDAAPD